MRTDTTIEGFISVSSEVRRQIMFLLVALLFSLYPFLLSLFLFPVCEYI